MCIIVFQTSSSSSSSSNIYEIKDDFIVVSIKTSTIKFEESSPVFESLSCTITKNHRRFIHKSETQSSSPLFSTLLNGEKVTVTLKLFLPILTKVLYNKPAISTLCIRIKHVNVCHYLI